MTLNEYQELALRTAMQHRDPTDSFIYHSLGLAGEAGECVDEAKKQVYHPRHPPNKERIAEELGDCIWYAAALARDLGLSLEDVCRRNIEKLQKRYPTAILSARKTS